METVSFNDHDIYRSVNKSSFKRRFGVTLDETKTAKEEGSGRTSGGQTVEKTQRMYASETLLVLGLLLSAMLALLIFRRGRPHEVKYSKISASPIGLDEGEEEVAVEGPCGS